MTIEYTAERTTAVATVTLDGRHYRRTAVHETDAGDVTRDAVTWQAGNGGYGRRTLTRATAERLETAYLTACRTAAPKTAPEVAHHA